MEETANRSRLSHRNFLVFSCLGVSLLKFLSKIRLSDPVNVHHILYNKFFFAEVKFRG